MAKKGESLKIFEDYIVQMMHDKLVEIQRQIENASEKESMDEVAELLVDANSWVSLLCGENEELYSEWRYRMFQTVNGQLVVVQGKEIDVDFRSWMKGAEE